MPRYTHNVSDEPLDIIAANECESQIGSLCTSRFRAVFNALQDALNERDTLTQERSELLEAFERIRVLPSQYSAGHDAANVAVEIARDIILKFARSVKAKPREYNSPGDRQRFGE